MSKSTRNTGLNPQQKQNQISGQKPLQVAVAVIKNPDGRVLISLRDKSLHQGGLWEFPGGKIEPGEAPLQALVREIHEETDIKVTSATPLITVRHSYSDLTVQLHVYLVEEFSGSAKGCEGQPLKWVSPDELTQFSFPVANRPIITAARLPPYYAILDDADETLIFKNLQKNLNRGIKLIQARLKRLPADTVNAFIEQAVPLCRQYGARLLMNSAVKLADGQVLNDIDSTLTAQSKTGIDGIHLTSQHLMQRTRRPENIHWLSASCHNAEELQKAQLIGADFVVLAPVLATHSHPGVNPMGWQHFRQLVAGTNLPVYALGGVTEANLSRARQSGGQGIAAVRAFL